MRLLTCAFTILLATAAHAAEEAHGGGGSTPFAGTIYQSLAAIIVFLILLTLLRKFAWGPILKGLHDREEKIRLDLEHAQQAADQAKRTLSEYQQQLARAHEEARRVIEQGRADAQKLANELQDQTQAQVEQMRRRAQQDIHQAKEQALSDLYTRVAALATDVAGRIIQRQITDQDQERLVQESITELNKLNRN